ncbi:BID domain-containing T4SS effector [Bartonella sp. B39]
MKKYGLYRFKRSTSTELNTGFYGPYNKECLIQHPEETVCADVSLYNKTLPLTKKQIFKKIQTNFKVRNCMEDVRYCCDLVYGNAGILNKQLTEIIENPKQGKDLSLNVIADPTNISKLAGKKVFGIKSSARKQAEKNVHSLCDAIETFMGVVYALRSEIVRTQMQQRNFDGLGSLEKIAIQNTHHTEEKRHSFLQEKSSHEIKNEASTSYVKAPKVSFFI